MKKYIFWTVLLIITFAVSSISAFAQCDKTKLTPVQCGYFEQGYQDGIKDAQEKLENNYKRHKKKYDKKNETFFAQGYLQGFNTITPFVRWDKTQRDIYERGYSNGADDKRKKISQLPARYEGKYPTNYEAFFVRGYNDGYLGNAKVYDIPIAVLPTKPVISTNDSPANPQPVITPTPIPTPTPAQINSGLIYWSGKVDDKISLVIRGNEISVSDISGTGFKENSKNIGLGLPRRASQVSVNKREGRGEILVMQQPNRQNDYTAIVQIVDSRVGMGNYKLDITWVISNIEEPYQSGTVFWSGRVDQTADIKIFGKDLQSVDVAGTGLSNVTANLNGYLARRIGTINVRKIRGRGTVSVIQQPDWENDFTAIIRISDTEKGNSDYQIEITW
jgi:hypothetical protein